MSGLGGMGRLSGRIEEARMMFDRVLVQSKGSEDLLIIADAQKGRGHVDIAREQQRSARETLKEAYGHYQKTGCARDAAQALRYLCQVDLLMDNHDRARVNFAQVRTMYQTINDPHGGATALRAIGNLESSLGRVPQAQQAYAEARILFQSVGDRISEADAALLIGLLEIGRAHV